MKIFLGGKPFCKILQESATKCNLDNLTSHLNDRHVVFITKSHYLPRAVAESHLGSPFS